MIAKALRDASLFSLVSFGEKGLTLITLPMLASRLSPADYGMLDLTTIAVNITALAAGLELYHGIMRQIPDAKSQQEESDMLSTAMVSVLFMAGVICLVAIPMRNVLSSWVYGGPGHAGLLLWAGALLGANCLSTLLYVVLRAQLRMGVLIRVTMLRIVVQAGAALLLVLGAGWKVEGLICAQLMGSLVVTILCARACRSLLRFTWNPVSFHKLFAFSGPLLVGSLCVILSQQGDRIAVREMLSVAEVGVLGTGYRFASVVAIATSGIAMTLSPLIYQSHARQETPREIARMFRFYLAMCFLLVLGLALVSEPLLTMLTPSAYHTAADTIPILGAAILLLQAPSFFPGLAISNRTKVMALIQISGLVLNLCGFVVLGRLFGLMGICLSGLLTQIYVTVISAWLSQRHYPIPTDWSKLMLFSAVSAGVVLLWMNFLQHTILTGIAVFSVGIASVLLFRMISREEIHGGLQKCVQKFNIRLRY